MRIISKFKDYYDIGLSMGVDDSIVYVRETREPHAKDWLTGWYSWHTCRENGKVQLSPFIIGFCGKFYPLVQVVVRPETRWSGITAIHQDDKVFFVYTLDDLLALAEKHKFEKEFQQTRWGLYNKKRDGWLMSKMREHFIKAGTANNNYFMEVEAPIMLCAPPANWGDNHEWFQKHLTSKRMVVNPCLKDFGFAKVVDPYRAFQEVSMYVGGVLPSKEADMATVSDEHRLAGHGYNKESFRMQKNAKPNRKSRKRGR